MDRCSEDVPSLAERLDNIRKLAAGDIELTIERLELLSRLPQKFLDSLGDADRTVCFRATLLCYSVTGGSQVPREMQLRAVLADYHGKDSLIAAGTGSGKTLPMALNMLLDDPTHSPVTLTLSPLKRLQSTQQEDFENRYKIPTVVINEDTPRDESWWNKNVYDMKKRQIGRARHLIVTVEQLFKSREGHLPRLYFLLRHYAYQKHVLRVNVDEVHNVHTAGLAHYGLAAFRPAWGRLDELKAILPHTIKWAGFSATVPPHILKTVEKKILRTNYIYIGLSSNRPNTAYATYQVTKSIDELSNYDCFLTAPFNFETQPRVLIFVDNKNLACLIASYLDSLLPPAFRNKNFAMHYHSGMSEKYLRYAHKSFTEENGCCRIMVATSSQSVGIDFPNVQIVCTVGLPTTIVDGLQRGGRAFRNSTKDALFVLFYEPWVHKVDLESYAKGDLDMSDPDRPRAALKPNSQRRERAPLSSVTLMKKKPCIRRYFAGYLADQSPEALLHTTKFCCDSPDHPDVDGCRFDLQAILPGLLPENVQPISIPTHDKKDDEKTNPKYRQTKDRPALDFRLIEWLQREHASDPLRAVRDPDLILSHSHRLNLVRAHPNQIKSPSDVTLLLNESSDWSEEWASKLFNVLETFKNDLTALTRQCQPQKRKRN